MAKDIKMPQLSDTMDSGKILTWLKKEGDQITRGDILAEVETDKANLEIESFDTGTLLKIAIPAGSVAKVGEIIAVLGDAGETVGASAPDSTSQIAPQSETSGTENTASASAPDPTSQVAVKTENVAEANIETPVSSVPATNTENTNSDRLKASPLAKKIAQENKIDLTNINGTGPNGRIVKKDLETIKTSAPVSLASIPNVSETKLPPVPAKAFTGGTRTDLTKMRATIAKRMQESMQVSPHFYMTNVINMGEAKKLREGLKVKEKFKGLSLNHFIIKATAYALSKEPGVNAAMHGEQLYQPAQINIGIITAIDGGLLIPVLKEVDQMKLIDVAFETRAAISRARAGRPTSADLSGGTFSISNMGMYDVENFTAIINPGQGGILAVSGMKEKAIVVDGEIKIGLEMKVTLSVDHRIIDGVTAAQFLAHLKEALEFPALLLV